MMIYLCTILFVFRPTTGFTHDMTSASWADWCLCRETVAWWCITNSWRHHNRCSISHDHLPNGKTSTGRSCFSNIHVVQFDKYVCYVAIFLVDIFY